MLYWTFLKEFKDLPQRREGAKNKNLKDFSSAILFNKAKTYFFLVSFRLCGKKVKPSPQKVLSHPKFHSIAKPFVLNNWI